MTRAMQRLAAVGAVAIWIGSCIGSQEEGLLLDDDTCRADTAAVGPGPSSKSAPLYDPPLVDFALTMDATAWATLQGVFEACRGLPRCEDREPGDNSTCCEPATRKVYAPGRFRFGGLETQADVRLKGTPIDWNVGEPFQLIIRFNLTDKSGRFLGLRRLNLEGRRHGGLVRNNLGMWLMRRAGVVAGRSNWARLTLNGEVYGIYENLEVVDRELLEDRFADPSGNLYKHAMPEGLKTNEAGADFADIDALHTLMESGPEAVAKTLDCIADVRSWVRLAAVEAVLPAGDNFWAASFNLYAYNDPAAGWTLIPWDLDDVLAENAAWDTDIWTGPQGVGLGDWWTAMLKNDTWRAWFEDEVQALVFGPYADAPAQVRTWCCAIREAVGQAKAHFSGIESFDRSCVDIMAQLTCRERLLKAALAGQPDPGCDPASLVSEGTIRLGSCP